MTECRTHNLLICSLHRSLSAVNTYFDRRCQERNLSPAEGRALGILGAQPGMSISALGQALGLKPSTITNVLDRLSARQMIERRPHPDDRRSLVITLTDSGRTVATWAQEVIEEFEKKITVRVSEENLRGFQTVLQAIQEISGGACETEVCRPVMVAED
ncbi:MAG TPA: MarR family transcriptional regulator [candidate division Zixibacteria bacterium]|nr:MarR family transcriptional regulator [candidate division Zixibacteria bacterium]